MVLQTNCYECKFLKKTGFFNNDTCFGGESNDAHVFIIGEMSHINDVGCKSFEKKMNDLG